MSAPRRYRNSQLRLLGSCGHAYAETYVHGRLGAPSPSLIAGSNVHAAIALAVHEIVRGGAFLDVHQLAYRAVQGGGVEYVDAVAVLTRFTESLAEEDGPKIDPRAAFLVEETLEMPVRLWSGEEVAFFGTPDLVQRIGRTTCEIQDWKTHWHPESEEEFRADPQLKRYALLVSHHYPAFERFVLVKRFVRYRGNVRRLEITRADLEAVRLELVSDIQVAREREEAGDLRAAGGDWCGLCAHHHTCPLVATYREAGDDLLSIRDDERATELAGAALALDAAATRIQTRLKRYLGDSHRTGVVPVSGGTYGFGPTTSRDLPISAARAAFEEHGVELPDAVLRIDLSALGQFSRRLPESLVREIERRTDTRESARCQFRKSPKSKPSTSPRPTPAAAATPAIPFAGEDDLL